MAAYVAASSVRSCWGNGAETFSKLLEGGSGANDLRYCKASALGVNRAYQIDREIEGTYRASEWLTECVREAVADSGINVRSKRVAAIVGTGLRELRTIEQWAAGSVEVTQERLHFAEAIRAAAPGVTEVITISNACSAGGHALAVAQDLVESGEVDAAIAAGTDSLTESMLAMIGRFREKPAETVRPFDREAEGVLLGEGAVALVLTGARDGGPCLGRVLSTGLSCDAHHETAPHEDGIRRAIRDAFDRASRSPAHVDLVVAHGTSTALNDPLEARLLTEIYGDEVPGPLITAVKGAVGHTSGGSALLSVDVALRAMRFSRVPPVAGLREPLAEGRALRLVIGKPAECSIHMAAVDAFGFGGVNSVTLLEKEA